MLDIKQLQIIDTIIQNPILTKSRLSEHLDLTGRQIDYAIEKLNQHLAEHHEPQIDTDGAYVVVPSAAYDYLLDLRASENLTALYHYTLSTSERQLFLGLLLACHDGYLSLIHLQDYLQVSQSTISKDLKALESALLDYQLRIHYDRQSGYKLEGQENKMRTFLIRSISGELFKSSADLLNTCADLIQHVDVQKTLAALSQTAKKYHIDFVENRLLEFGYILIFMVSRLRIKPDYLPSRAKKIDLMATNEYAFAADLLKQVGVDQSVAAEYLTTIVLCLSIGGLDHLRLDQHIFGITNGVVQRFSDISGIVFSDSHKVSQQMFTHFRSMYYRLQFNYPITNPLTEQVIEEYGEIFTLVAQAVQSYEDELGKVPDDEIAFLTIHLISFIYTTDSKKNDFVTAAIVCPNGIGNSALAYLQLTNLFPNIKFLKPFRYVDLDEHLDEIDLIFSTFYRSDLFTKNKPCFIINPIMTTEEKYNLIQKVNSQMSSTSFAVPTLNSVMAVVAKTVKKAETLNRIRRDLSDSLFKAKVVDQAAKLSLVDVLRESYIQLRVEAKDPEDAIRQAAAPLVADEAIEQDYVENIVHGADKRPLASYVIAPHVALPHADPRHGANRVAIGITVLAEPMAFDDDPSGQPVQFIFVLSAINSTDHLAVLQDLMDLLATPSFFAELTDPAQDPTHLLQYLRGQRH